MNEKKQKFSQWFGKNSFHYDQFNDIDRLVKLKNDKNLSISVVLPTLNEENTVGREIAIIKKKLVYENNLVDEIIVVDSGSIDATVEVAKAHGADVYKADDCLTKYRKLEGKGENLWKALFLTKGDIIVYVDADIKNFDSKFIYGLVGPILENDDIGYIKAFYKRPRIIKDKIVKRRGGRVTEILVRPLLNLFFPDLKGVVTPLAGEYAGRREILEKVPFLAGYPVEIGLLIDIYKNFGLDSIGQVDLGTMMHEHKDLKGLGKMSFDILHGFFQRMKDYNMCEFNTEINEKIHFLEKEQGEYLFIEMETNKSQRPPMITIKEYIEKFKKQN